MKTVVIWNTENPAAHKTAADFVAAGWRVVALGAAVPGAENPAISPEDPAALAGIAALPGLESIDMLVLCAAAHATGDGPAGTTRDYDAVLATLDQNVNGTLALAGALLPSLRRGAGKRICLLAQAQDTPSVATSTATQGYGWQLSRASLNMQQKIWFNALRPEGFTFRNFVAEESAEKGMSAMVYFTRNLCFDEKEPYIHSDENRLVMRDAFRRELGW